MTADEIGQAARKLLAHRDEQRVIPVAAGTSWLADPATGYAIQECGDAILRRERGWRRIGYKIGATNAASRAALGTPVSFYGRIYDRQVSPSPARLAWQPSFLRLYEPEIALRLGRDLDPAAAPFDAAAIAAATDAVLPVIEIIGTRFEPWIPAGVASLIADNGVFAHWVTGVPVRDWAGLDLLGGTVTLAIDGAIVATGTGANVDGGAFASAAWLANALAERGLGLQAGDHISTGAAAQPMPIGPGQQVRADFGPLGSVELTISA